MTLTLLLIFAAGLYLIKQKSANGRILIWRCSIDMIKDKPLFGFGTNGFRKNYMIYQANYIKNNKANKYQMLADNVNYSYNEYILLLIHYGISGFVLFVFISGFIWKSYKRSSRENNYTAGFFLISLGIISMFSYPFFYPLIWILCILSICIIINNAEYSFLVFPNYYIRFSYIFIIILILIRMFNISKRMYAEIRWSKIAHKSMQIDYKTVCLEYNKLFHILNNNPQFLYNYAAISYYNQDYKLSLFMANKLQQQLANYDLEMLVGDNLFNLGQYSKAMESYLISANMCPGKFYPLYQLAKVYEAMQDTSSLKIIVREIINKPVKIESDDVIMIKHSMEIKYDELMQRKD